MSAQVLLQERGKKGMFGQNQAGYPHYPDRRLQSWMFHQNYSILQQVDHLVKDLPAQTEE